MAAPPSQAPAGGGTSALFVRIPSQQAERLDRAAFELKTAKRELVTKLLARYVDPSTPAGLRALRELGEAPDGGAAFGAGRRRITVETEGDALTVGRHSFRPTEAPEVLTVEELAELLQVQPGTVLELAERGEVPGRRLGYEWRFARRAVLSWLAGSGDLGGSSDEH